MSAKMNLAALPAALMLLGCPIDANAGYTTYADFAAWSAAVAVHNAVVIPDPTGPDGYDTIGSGTASISYGGVLFSTSAALGDGEFYNVGPAFFYPDGDSALLSSQQQTTGVANILITLAAPVKALALNFDTFNVPNQLFGYDVTFELSNGTKLTLGSAGNAYDLGSFFGIVDDNPFKTVLLTSEGEVLNLNGLNLGEAVSAIPEPATWVMLMLGFAGIVLWGYRLPARRAPTG